MSQSTPPTPVSAAALLRSRTVITSYDSYPQAQRAVDFLSDHDFPVQHLSIVGSDLRSVEMVTGRMTYGRAAAAGMLSGAWFGLFVGLLLGLFSSTGANGMNVVFLGLLFGAAFGIVFGLIAHASSRGRRDFASVNQIMATRYDVLCDPGQVAAAQALLATMPVA